MGGNSSGNSEDDLGRNNDAGGAGGRGQAELGGESGGESAGGGSGRCGQV